MDEGQSAEVHERLPSIREQTAPSFGPMRAALSSTTTRRLSRRGANPLGASPTESRQLPPPPPAPPRSLFQATPEHEPPTFSPGETNEGVEGLCRIRYAAETKERLMAENKAFAKTLRGQPDDTVRLTEHGVEQQVQRLRDGLMSQGTGEPSLGDRRLEGTFQ